MNDTLKISITSSKPEVHQIIQQLLLPWKIAFTNSKEAEVFIYYEKTPSEDVNSIVIPSDSNLFNSWMKQNNLKYETVYKKEVLIKATELTKLFIQPQIFYNYYGMHESYSLRGTTSAIKLDSKLLLAFDIIQEYQKIINATFNPKISTYYRLFANLPVTYTVIPKTFRNFIMKRESTSTFDLNHKLPLDALRFLLVKGIEEITSKRLKRKMWNGKNFISVLTHDIDTFNGLKRSKLLKRLEDKYNIPSVWFVPTKRYELHLETIRELANNGEIAAHDTKHDGKLVGLPIKKIIARLYESRICLEKIISNSVIGFRAPLLQFTSKLLQALDNAGFKYDASIPTWEPNHPYTMKPHGIGSSYLFKFNKIVEVPLTMPQDHQMLYILGVSPRHTIETWIKTKSLIKEIGGVFTTLVHPDYDFTKVENINFYEELLNNLSSDNDTRITTPSKMITNLST